MEAQWDEMMIMLKKILLSPSYYRHNYHHDYLPFMLIAHHGLHHLDSDSK